MSDSIIPKLPIAGSQWQDAFLKRETISVECPDLEPPARFLMRECSESERLDLLRSMPSTANLRAVGKKPQVNIGASADWMEWSAKMLRVLCVDEDGGQYLTMDGAIAIVMNAKGNPPVMAAANKLMGMDDSADSSPRKAV